MKTEIISREIVEPQDWEDLSNMSLNEAIDIAKERLKDFAGSYVYGSEDDYHFRKAELFAAVDNLILAARKQIPQKPVLKTVKKTKVHICPLCGQEFGFNTGFTYCEKCGQKIDRSGAQQG